MRSLEALQRDQADILNASRTATRVERDVAQLPRTGIPISVAVYGKVFSVVASDQTYGPHLMVARHRFSGTPPALVAAGGSDIRCYPSPNRSVQDYSVGEIVRIMVTPGAMIAELLA